MAEKIRLVKSDSIRLSKVDSQLRRVSAGMGWNPRGSNYDWDLDLSMLVVNSRGDVVKEISWRNKERSHEFYYYGDDLVGGSGYGGNDDEKIDINFQNLPSSYEKIVVVMNIYEAFSKRQNLTMVRDAYIHLTNTDTSKELVEYPIEQTAQFAGKTAMFVGEFYKENGEWSFRAIGEPVCVRHLSELGNMVRDKYSNPTDSQKTWEEFLRRYNTGSTPIDPGTSGRGQRRGFFGRLFGD